ncbi:MAG: DUF92 domain-containing protein, partial [bacterium]|nr:DUF92 domain-containing protein [bacterium]
TLLGSLGAVAGACVLAVVARVAGVAPLPAVAVAGVAGAALDSLIGATLQGQRYCAQCAEACETDPHRCGAQTRLVRGLASIDNDGVNFAATLCGALAAYLLA